MCAVGGSRSGGEPDRGTGRRGALGSCPIEASLPHPYSTLSITQEESQRMGEVHPTARPHETSGCPVVDHLADTSQSRAFDGAAIAHRPDNDTRKQVRSCWGDHHKPRLPHLTPRIDVILSDELAAPRHGRARRAAEFEAAITRAGVAGTSRPPGRPRADRRSTLVTNAFGGGLTQRRVETAEQRAATLDTPLAASQGRPLCPGSSYPAGGIAVTAPATKPCVRSGNLHQTAVAKSWRACPGERQGIRHPMISRPRPEPISRPTVRSSP
jgi:hypothetical protein